MSLSSIRTAANIRGGRGGVEREAVTARAQGGGDDYAVPPVSAKVNFGNVEVGYFLPVVEERAVEIDDDCFFGLCSLHNGWQGFEQNSAIYGYLPRY